MAQSAKQNRRPDARWYYVFIALSLILATVFVTNAWVVDDAYITFRTVDNFVNGYGLTWNVGERVQVYTHPLWMLLVSVIYFVTSECFYTSIVISFVLAILAIWVAVGAVTGNLKSNLWKASFFIIAVLASKAVVDYASSGLENALSYLIAAIFLTKFLTLDNRKAVTARDLGIYFFLASLAFLNRPDTVILYFPALIYLVYLNRHLPLKQLVAILVVATLPATLWTIFSIVYYGYPFPNTAYAKAFSLGVPMSWKLQTGWEYFVNSLYWDTASNIMVGIAIWMAIRSRRISAIAPMLGVLLYVLYIIFSAAAATHMSGRFFAVPFFIAILVLVYTINIKKMAAILAAALVIHVAWSPVSSIKYGTDFYKAYPQNRKCIDTKYYVLQEGAALLNWESGKKMPDHAWYHYGEEFRQQPYKVHIGGALRGDAIGYMGYAMGPDKYVLDRVALSCPLLSRLPAIVPPSANQLKSGHFQRVIPDGYPESIANGRNMIKDDSLRLFYDIIRTITREPIFSADRFGKIWRMNLGMYDHLAEAYVRRNPMALGRPSAP